MEGRKVEARRTEDRPTNEEKEVTVRNMVKESVVLKQTCENRIVYWIDFYGGEKKGV